MAILPRQEGKTELGIRLLRDLTGRPFTKSSLFLAKSHASAKKMAREKFLRLFERNIFAVNTELVYHKAHPTSQVFIESVDVEPDRLRGGTYGMIHWAEVAFSKFQLGVTVMDVWDKCVGPTLKETDGFVYLESTNNGKNGWYDLWTNAKEFGFATLRVSLSEMVHLGLVEQWEYDQLSRTTQPDVFRQEYECEFITFMGKVYPEFQPFHVLLDMPGPRLDQKVAIAIDWGYHPSATCVLFAYIQGGQIFVFDELYETEQLPIATAEAIRAKLAHWSVTSFGAVADHEPDRNEELNRRGIACSPADKVDLLGNRVQIKELLFQNRLFFHPRCKFTLRDLDAAVWDLKKSDKGEIDYQQCTWGHFDAEAALRYLVRELGEMESAEPQDRSLLLKDEASAEMQMARRRAIADGFSG